MSIKNEFSVFAPKQPKKGGTLRVRVKFTDTGNVYDITLIETETAKEAVEGSNSAFLAIPGLVLVDEATMEKAKSILRELIESGFFDGLAPVDE
jgi:hypothetical protein